jgi:hypothetical protein
MMQSKSVKRPGILKFINRDTFDELESRLDPILKRNEEMGRRSSGSPISTRTRLAITLRWLAGGSYIDICFAWGISEASFYSDRGALWPTIEALDKLFELGLDISTRLNWRGIIYCCTCISQLLIYKI